MVQSVNTSTFSIKKSVLQALLALFDTQEAPKSLGLDSSSSSESLNEESKSEIPQTSSSPLPGSAQQQLTSQRSISPQQTVKSMTPSMILPPLPINRPQILSGGGAFISYVRRRGEPDGGRNDAEAVQKNPIIHGPGTLYPILDSSLANTTDSELSDGYTSHTLYKTKAPRLGYSSLRGPIKVSRPGGGGESDAAFTPSPPVTTQTVVDPNVSMALAHHVHLQKRCSIVSSIFYTTSTKSFHCYSLSLSTCLRNSK